MIRKITVIAAVMLALSVDNVVALSPPYIKSIVIEGKDNIEMKVGETIELTAAAAPVGVDYVYMNWVSENQGVIAVEGAAVDTALTPPTETVIITALQPGIATVTVGASYRIGDQEVTDSVTIEVTEPYSEEVIPKYPYVIEELSLLSPSGEELIDIPYDSGFVVEATLNKVQERKRKDCIFAAVYGTDGQLLNLDYVMVDFAANSECSLRFNIPAAKESVGSVKAYVWNSFDSLEPLAKNKEPLNK